MDKGNIIIPASSSQMLHAVGIDVESHLTVTHGLLHIGVSRAVDAVIELVFPEINIHDGGQGEVEHFRGGKDKLQVRKFPGLLLKALSQLAAGTCDQNLFHANRSLNVGRPASFSERMISSRGKSQLMFRVGSF